MSCYHPMVGIPTGEHWTSGKNKYRFVGIGPDGLLTLKFEYPDGIIVPCGKCYGCRMDYSRKWADRMMLELQVEKKAIFITLTYNDDHVPKAEDDDGNVYGLELCKRDLQLFFKRLRRRYDGHDGRDPIKIRFYASGEYGETFHRPHYHAIVYGLDLNDFPKKVVRGMNDLKQPYYEDGILNELWSDPETGAPIGFASLCEVTYETCAYVARYVAKKVDNDWDPVDYDLQPEFSLMSRNPGIGVPYFEKHPECVNLSWIQLPDGRKASVPRLFNEKSRSEEELREKHRKDKRIAEHGTKYRMQESNVLVLDQLAASERLRRQKAKVLSRSCVE